MPSPADTKQYVCKLSEVLSFRVLACATKGMDPQEDLLVRALAASINALELEAIRWTQAEAVVDRVEALLADANESEPC
jgi:mannose/cellobiose epimerase-like protein (N-acyl-D-glucosamine 2-epimerase family)